MSLQEAIGGFRTWIHRFYESAAGSPAQKEADQWLTMFQASNEAWYLCLEVGKLSYKLG